jgi:hypothetical protein
MSHETHNCADTAIENIVNTMIGRCDAMVTPHEEGVTYM